MSFDLDAPKIEDNQFAILNYGYENGYEWLQCINRFVSTFLCVLLHFSIVSRLLVVNKFKVKSDYQILIIVQSVMNIISCIFDLILNEIQMKNINYIKIGHPFWHFSMTERVIFMVSAKTSSMSTQDFLMVFNLHRLFIIKKKSLMKLYAIAIPIMLIGPIGDAYIKYPIIMAGRDIGLFVKHSQVPFIAVVIIICREKLKKEFDTNPTFSEKTKQLQKKLGLSVFMQVGLLCIIALIITIIPWLCENIFDESTYIAYSVYYLIYASVITQWYPFCSACLIAWSITGFFKNQSPPTTIQHSDTKIFQVEPQNIGARKQSTRLSLV